MFTLAVSAPAADVPVHYSRDVKPLLAGRCYACQAAASRRRGMRMGPNVAPVFRQNRGKNAVFSKSLGPVVGMAGQQLLSAIDLFGEHGASQQVRPGHGAE